MPGYILHLTAAQMFLKQTKKEQELFVNKQETNNFFNWKSDARYNKR